MLGATHALANPLTARYGIVHGQAIGLMLPHVIRFNGARYGRLVSRLAGRDRRRERISESRRAASKDWREFVAESGPQGRAAGEVVASAASTRRRWPNWRPTRPSNGPVNSIPARSTRPNCWHFTRRLTDGPLATIDQLRRQALPWPWWLCRIWRRGTAGGIVGLRAAAQRPADTWPLFRGNTLATGVVERNACPRSWKCFGNSKRKEGGFEATAVIDDGMVYVGSLDGNFYAIDRETGEEQWKYHTELGFSAAAAVRRRPGLCRRHRWQVLLLRRGRRQVAVGLRSHGRNQLGAEFLQEHWCCSARKTPRSMRSTPRPASWPGNMRSAIRSAARPRWSTAGRWWPAATASLHIIDLDDGKEIGDVEIDSPTGSTPAVLGRSGFFRHRGGNVFCHRLARGQGELDGQGRARAVDPLVGRRDRGAGRSSAPATNGCMPSDVSDGNEAWSFATRSRVDSCPVVVGERVFVGSGDGRLYALDRKTGEKTWNYEAGGQFTASPAVAAGRLVIGNHGWNFVLLWRKIDVARRLSRAAIASRLRPPAPCPRLPRLPTGRQKQTMATETTKTEVGSYFIVELSAVFAMDARRVAECVREALACRRRPTCRWGCTCTFRFAASAASSATSASTPTRTPTDVETLRRGPVARDRTGQPAAGDGRPAVPLRLFRRRHALVPQRQAAHVAGRSVAGEHQLGPGRGSDVRVRAGHAVAAQGRKRSGNWA